MGRRDLLLAIARTTGDHFRTLKRLGFQLIAEPPSDQATNQQELTSKNNSADIRTSLKGTVSESGGLQQIMFAHLLSYANPRSSLRAAPVFF